MTDRNPDLVPRYGTVDNDYLRRLATTPPDEDGPVWMINLMSYREVAQYADGRETTISGQEADDLYAPLGPLAAVGAEVAYFATVESQLLGDAPRWDRIGVVKYATRRSFIDMQKRPDFAQQHVHKEAGMASTIVMGGIPFDAPAVPPDAPNWDDVPHPPTADDGPVTMLHVIRFRDGGADGDMLSYQDAAGQIALPHGMRISAWFRVEGTILGDGRAWDQARFNSFPSKAAFMAVARDPARLAAQAEHREAAIADTYTMILRPTIDRLADTIRS